MEALVRGFFRIPKEKNLLHYHQVKNATHTIPKRNAVIDPNEVTAAQQQAKRARSFRDEDENTTQQKS